MRKANTTSVNKHEPSYEQLEVKTDRTSFYAKSQRTLQHRIVNAVDHRLNPGKVKQLTIKFTFAVSLLGMLC
jgi:predicted component of type VI protein secretion system